VHGNGGPGTAEALRGEWDTNKSVTSSRVHQKEHWKSVTLDDGALPEQEHRNDRLATSSTTPPLKSAVTLLKKFIRARGVKK